jgi:hypothetical protein
LARHLTVLNLVALKDPASPVMPKSFRLIEASPFKVSRSDAGMG